MDYLTGLNEMQKKAVETTEGPLLVVAGAGSGKTRVVTHRIAYLIEEKAINPANILALTFTNKAADEMKTRVAELLNRNVDRMWIGTFHSICVRILRYNIDKIGYTNNFTIYDSLDQRTLVKECMKELDYEFERVNEYAILSKISELKDASVDPDDFIKDSFNDFMNERVGRIYKLYQEKLRQNNALDFDDLLGKTVELFEEDQEVLEYYQDKFHYIFVDEYQDTNKIQYKLVKLLSEKNQNICVVGDTDQSIYGWRGADIRNILDFEKDFEDAQTIYLEQNYRSTQTILDVANKVIAKNYNKPQKQLWTEDRGGGPVEYQELQNGDEEAYFVASKIQELVSKRRHKESDIAILYRTNAQSRSFEEAFMKRGISYKIVGGLRFYDRKEVKDIMAYLQVLQNPLDNISLKRIVNTPKRGIGDATIGRLENYANKNSLSLYEAILECDEIEKLSTRAKNSLKGFMKIINTLIAKKELLEVNELIRAVAEDSEYIESLEEDDTVESRTRIDNIEEFINVADRYVIEDDGDNPAEEKSLEDFVSRISLLSDVDKTEDEDSAVTMMTIHSSKGLEFPVVFLVGLEEGLLPNGRAIDSGKEEEIEEERRLCYVAVTRAEKELYLTCARQRFMYGRTKYSAVSRFIDEMGDTIRDTTVRDRPSSSQQKIRRVREDFDTSGFMPANREEIEVDSLKLKLGDKVKHKLWGQGMIVEVDGDDGEIVMIAFDNKGLKKLDTTIAPLEKI